MRKETEHIIKPTNSIKLRGTIIGIRSSTSMTSLIIITDGNGQKGSTVANVSFYGPMKEGFKTKDHVDIIAHMQSKLVKSDDKNRFHQIVVGDKIRLTNRMLADYIPLKEIQNKEGGIPDDINKAFVYGKVSRVYAPNDSFAIVTVIVPTDEKKLNYVDVFCYRRQAQTAALLTEGDFIVCAGELRTDRERPKEKDELFRQNVLCKDMEKVNEEYVDLSGYMQD